MDKRTRHETKLLYPAHLELGSHTHRGGAKSVIKTRVLPRFHRRVPDAFKLGRWIGLGWDWVDVVGNEMQAWMDGWKRTSIFSNVFSSSFFLVALDRSRKGSQRIS